ncbi:hypothetical protein ACW9HR_37225, partial [Nocardia gipuzkoensis]
MTTRSKYVLTDGHNLLLGTDYARTPDGVLTVDMTVPPTPRATPIRIVLNGATIADRCGSISLTVFAAISISRFGRWASGRRR